MKTCMKNLYCMMYDDLKDADTIAHYAKDTVNHNKDMSKYFAQHAKHKLEHFKEVHRKFNDLAEEHKTVHPQEMMENKCWEVSYEHLMEWHTHIEMMLKHLDM